VIDADASAQRKHSDLEAVVRYARDHWTWTREESSCFVSGLLEAAHERVRDDLAARYLTVEEKKADLHDHKRDGFDSGLV
jgi:hypothetical protein